MARLAYTFPIAETIGVYVEALPGYSLITVPGELAKGFVFAFGAGADMEITNRIFATLGAGYQLGFQSLTSGRRQVRCSDPVRSREPGRRRQVLGSAKASLTA